MPGSSLLALIDDIAVLLDDVAILTKVATKKTAGVLGDDLALNAEQVVGVAPQRELPVVAAVAKGSSLNKLILVPSALLISAVAPWAITPLLMLGGAFLCFEGCEKVAHKLFHTKVEDDAHHKKLAEAAADTKVDMVAFERDKIRGAIRTDFILSAEIIVITLGTVAHASLVTQVAVLCAIAVLMTVGVYGLVAGIVKLDNAGMALRNRRSAPLRALGSGILRTAPLLMKLLSIAGTAAMFLVGGGILLHGIPGAGHFVEARAPGGALGLVVATAADALVGVVAGVLALAIVGLAKRVFRRARGKSEPRVGEAGES
jgi:predicted DNA repair protein MutK